MTLRLLLWRSRPRLTEWTWTRYVLSDHVLPPSCLFLLSYAVQAQAW